jgi:hypothetical protein
MFQGTITSGDFDEDAFPGGLRNKFYETDAANGTPGTYTRQSGESETWTKE